MIIWIKQCVSVTKFWDCAPIKYKKLLKYYLLEDSLRHNSINCNTYRETSVIYR